MTRNVRITVAFAALLMSAAYALPLWRIGLIAPQYPEGLGMLIHVDAIGGFKEGDLQSINGLNHYIGMKTIEPDAIPELKWMPLILGALIVTGLGVAALGRKRPFIAWTVVLASVCTAGLVDYWKWGYDYGHDLSPTAIIKIPGMTYQPPLIGSKQLLNFTATSWPASGGWLLILATSLVVGALVVTLVRRRAPAAMIGAVSLAAAAACAPAGPKSVVLGEDNCDYCRMTIVDARYGGQAITTTGRAYKFDSVECLANWVRTAPAGTVRDVYVIDLQHPGTFVRADSAGFLTGVLINGPMGKGIVGFANAQSAEQQRAMVGGRISTWNEIVADTTSHAHSGQ
ncbi:MAG TPA: nitrous oxide reductase accessory protein NosL [Gemmatimonadaceae bacterium]|nr:nitrous oxide reductase accessory protein NosL [Gemmatimonadaceae bacterium]